MKDGIILSRPLDVDVVSGLIVNQLIGYLADITIKF